MLKDCTEGERAQLQLKDLKWRFVNLQNVAQTDVTKLKTMLADLSADYTHSSDEFRTLMGSMESAAERARKVTVFYFFVIF